MNKRLIHTVFTHTAERFPSHTAIEAGSHAVTYANLNTRANQLAHLLQACGIERDQVVGVLLPSGIELVTALLATFKAGGIYLPMDKALATQRLQRMFQQCTPQVLLAPASEAAFVQELLSMLEYQPAHILLLNEATTLTHLKRNESGYASEEISLETYAAQNPDTALSPQDSNYIFYTSGSTGEPKAILGCHDSLSHFIHWEMKEFGTDDTWRVSQLTQITFDASLRDIFVPLCSGGTLCIPPPGIKTNFVQLADWLETARIRLIHSVPSVFRLLTKTLALREEKTANTPFSELRHFLLAGEMLYAKDIQNWQQQVGTHVEVVNLYGPTETTMIKTFHRIHDLPADPAAVLPVGKPISNTIVAILDGETPCVTGEIGSVYIKTPFMTKGYLNNPEATAQVFVQNPLVKDKTDIVYKTGDLGRFREDGTLEILGREDRQVKVNGVRVEPAEIERALLSIEGIQETIVVPHIQADNQTELLAYYTGTTYTPDNLRTRLATVLNAELLPSYLIHLEEMPLNLNGKVDKKALPKPAELLADDLTYEPVQTDIERTLEQLWKDILGISRIGRNASFFAIGGNSLKAIQLISRMYKTYGKVMLVREIFDAPTIAQLADWIQKNVLADTYQQIPVVPAQPHYELSHAQKRLWVLNRFNRAQAAYHIQGAFVLEGALHRDAFERVFTTLIARHEALRTTFTTLDGEPRQVIHLPEEILFSLEYKDLQTDPDPEATAQQRVFAHTQQPFDLERGPLMRALLLQLDATTHQFVFTMHHIISDGWSIELLINEVLKLYHAYTTGTQPDLMPLRIQYKDFAHWQNQQLQGESLHKLQQYWLTQLGCELPVLHLPTDFPRPAMQSFRGDWVTTQLSPELTQQLQALAQRTQTSLFMVLLAAVNGWLYRYTGQEDIIIGTPVAGRPHTDLEDQVGFYINNLALRTRFQGIESFETLLSHVKETTLQAFDHQLYPFDRLVEELNLVRDTSRSPVFDVVLVLQNMGLEGKGTPDWQDLRIRSLDSGFRSSTVDLRMVCVEREEGLFITFEYNTDLFTRETMQRMAGHFTTLTAAAVQATTEPVYTLPYLSETETQLLLHTFNATTYPLDRTLRIHDIVAARAAERPEHIAVQTAKNQLTYQELNEQSDQLAAYLQTTYALTPGAHIGLMLSRSEQMIVALLAILKAGAVYVPIAPELPAHRKAFICSDANIQVLLTESEYVLEVAEYFSGDGLPLAPSAGGGTLWGFILPQELTDRRQVSNSPSCGGGWGEAAYLIYTSGSTGTPKGVVIEHHSLVNMSLDQVRQFGIRPDDKVLQFAALSFDASVYEIFMGLFAGATLVLTDAATIQQPQRFTDYLANKQVTVATLPPSFVSALPNGALSNLRVLITAGEAANVADLVAYTQQNVQCINAYGPTECAVCVSTYHVSAADENRTTLPIGKPISNTKLYLLDAWLQPVAIGVEGDLYVSGEGLAREYLNQPELTAEWFIQNPFSEGVTGFVKEGAKIPLLDKGQKREFLSQFGAAGLGVVEAFGLGDLAHPPSLSPPPTQPHQTGSKTPVFALYQGGEFVTRLYRTGDRAKWLPDGNLVFLGRKDSQVKLHGYRIELGEIEAVLSRHPQVKDALVSVRHDATHDSQLVAYYTTDTDELPELKSHVQQYLPAYMVPAAFVRLPAFPLTVHGKIAHDQLPNPLTQTAQLEDYVAPETPLQHQLVAIWEKVLGRNSIGIHTNFFEIGGHSLKATQVLSLVQEAFQIRLDLGHFFTTPTIAALAEAIAHAETQADLQIPVLEAQETYEVSDAQRRMWVLHQLGDAGAAYELPAAFTLQGTLDIEAFCNAFDTLVERHESLRTTFETIDGEPRQRIQTAAGLNLAVGYTDLRTAAHPAAEADEQLTQLTTRSFDLEAGPLVRAHLWQLADETYLFGFVMHHSIGDEWSLPVLVQEWLTLYNAYRQGQENPLLPLRIQYKEFAAWQRNQLHSEAFAAHQQFWVQEFADGVPALDLPTDFPRPEVKTYRGDAVTHTLNPRLSQQLADTGKQHETTLFTVLSATLYALLYRYTGQEDIIIGTPVALRNHADVQNQIGLFLNTLAIRMQVQADTRFTDLLQALKQKMPQVYAHQDYPFDRLVDELNLPRDTSRTPLFDVMLVLHDREAEENALPHVPGLSIEPRSFASAYTKFDISFNIRETDNGLQINAEYNTDLFTSRWLHCFLTHYEALVTQLLAQPDAAILQVNYLSEEEKNRLLVEYNATAADFPSDKTIVQLFEKQAAATPEAVAIRFEDISVSYRQLNELSNQLAHFLIKKYDIQTGDCIALQMHRSERMLVALLGILKTGAAYLPLDPVYPAERIRYMLDDAEARCLIGDGVDVYRYQTDACPVVSMQDWEAIRQCSTDNLPARACATDLLYILYTSGSTGRPKGVMLEHRGLVNRLYWMWKHYEFTDKDIVLQKTPYVFDVSVWELFMPLCFGASLVPCPQEVVFDAQQLVNYIADYQVTTLHFVPSMLNLFLQGIPEPKGENGLPQLASVRAVFASGEALLPHTVAEHYRKTQIPLHNLYGPTEASIEVSQYTAQPSDTQIPIGTPISNVELHVLDQAGQLVPEGVWGELAIGGVCLARGYLNRPDLTEEKFVHLSINQTEPRRLYWTGDICRWQNGQIEYKGRKDTQIKLRGQRIELSEIENCLLTHPHIEAAAVAIQLDLRQEQVLVGYVVTREEVEPLALRQHLALSVPAYMIPAQFVFLDKLPLTVSGKLDRKALPEPQVIPLSAYAAPATDIERQLSEVWQDVLGASQVSLDDNFFDVGGNSLRLILMYQKMKPYFTELKVTDLFKHTTIRSLSEFLATEEETSDMEGIEV